MSTKTETPSPRTANPFHARWGTSGECGMVVLEDDYTALETENAQLRAKLEKLTYERDEAIKGWEVKVRMYDELSKEVDGMLAKLEAAERERDLAKARLLELYSDDGTDIPIPEPGEFEIWISSDAALQWKGKQVAYELGKGVIASGDTLDEFYDQIKDHPDNSRVILGFIPDPDCPPIPWAAQYSSAPLPAVDQVPCAAEYKEALASIGAELDMSVENVLRCAIREYQIKHEERMGRPLQTISMLEGVETPPPDIVPKAEHEELLKLAEAVGKLEPHLPGIGDCLDEAAVNEYGMSPYHSAAMRVREALSAYRAAHPTPETKGGGL